MDERGPFAEETKYKMSDSDRDDVRRIALTALGTFLASTAILLVVYLWVSRTLAPDLTETLRKLYFGVAVVWGVISIVRFNLAVSRLLHRSCALEDVDELGVSLTGMIMWCACFASLLIVNMLVS